MSDNKQVKRISSDQPTALIAPSDYEHIFKGGNDDKREAKGANSLGKVVNINKSKPELTRVKSEQPTALIAPSDYEHIFKADDDVKPYDDKVANNKNKTFVKVSSSVPVNTAQCKESPRVVNRIPTDTPTALIAPSDFEHIYRDPQSDSKDNMKKTIEIKTRKVPSRMKPSNTSINRRNCSKLSEKSRKRLKEGQGPRRSASKSSERHHQSPPPPQTKRSDREQETLPPSIQLVVKKFIERQKKTYTINKK